jgi:hypothetical protein
MKDDPIATILQSLPPVQVDTLQPFVVAPTPPEISAAFNKVTAETYSSRARAAIIRLPLVMVESPYKGLHRDVAESYAEAACWDCMTRGEAPFASHLIYTRFLDDGDPESRKIGMLCGRAWIRKVDYMVVYTDLGLSEGMTTAVNLARKLKKDVEFRTL